MSDPEPTYIDDMIAADREREREWNKRRETSMTDRSADPGPKLREIEERAISAVENYMGRDRYEWIRPALCDALASLRRDGYVLVRPMTGDEQGGIFNSIVVRHGPQPFDDAEGEGTP